ncbi:MAG: 4Fe-4S dicluster domain-containing protein [Planctomycetes bacterium]|nr:4Fe-4S dicluster domain-containing protein [Planctomycetota bacterium]
MAQVLVIDHEKCTSCRLCELACSERYGGAYQPSRAHIHVAIYPEDALYLPMVCMQCDDAPCIPACPSGALRRDSATNAVVVVAERCVGCRMCALACPFGAINYWDGKAHKCDLCGGEPECVRYCAPGALRYERVERYSHAARQAYADRLRGSLKEVVA